MPHEARHQVVHAPTGWVVAGSLTLPQANAIRHALARHPEGSGLVEHAAAGDRDALRLVKHLLDETLKAVTRAKSIEAAEVGAMAPEAAGVELPVGETVQRLRVALSALSDVPWVVEVVRGVIIIRPPANRQRHLQDDGTALATAFGLPLEEAQVLIPPEGRVLFVAKAESNALKALGRTEKAKPKAGGGAVMRTRSLSASPLGLLLARVLGDAHEPLTFAEVVKEVRRACHKEAPGVILATLDAMRRDGYVKVLPGDLFVTGSW